MYRKPLLIFLGVVVLWCIGADLLLAQDWPQYDTGRTNKHFIDRGPGIYLGIVKLLSCVLIFLLWVKTSDWVSEDVRSVGESVGLSGTVWNPVIVFSFLAAFLFCAISIPIFAIGYTVLVIAYLAPLGAYILMRNAKVPDSDRVLTAAHIASLFSGRGSKPALAPHEKGAQIEITSLSGDEQERQANIIAARQDPNYLQVKDLYYEAVTRQAARIMLDYTRESVAARLLVDGVWHNLEPRDRESGDAMLVVLKTICGANPEDRRSRQVGKFALAARGGKYTGDFTSQGVKTGERVIIDLVRKGKAFKTLEDLGMREKMRQQLEKLLKAKAGFFIFSAVPEGGLSTTWEVGLLNTDRLMRDFMGIEDKDKPQTHVQNIEIQTFNGAAGETPVDVLPKPLLKQPEALVLSDLVNGETVKLLCEQVLNERKLVITKLRSKESAEALLRVLLLKAPADLFSRSVTGVLNQRLVRKLCPDCKQAYEPPPALLQRLGIPPGRVKEFYREYQPPPPGEEPKRKKGEPEVCPTCRGIGYRGRIGVFELLVVNDELRQVLRKQPKLETLRAAARKTGTRSLQEEGILLVATGVTSLQELQRILAK
jgi:type II secretory ATPase GspE/PulE/Tfp pilus assembly ATPase PilB-like protein